MSYACVPRFRPVSLRMLGLLVLCGARIRWVNRQQSVHVLASEPWASRPRQRTGPLTDAQLQSGLNLALALRWGAGGASVCHLQRTEDQARRSGLARGVLNDLSKRETP